ncbi:MAG: hypothetical protein LUG98_13140, partial [Tannerellaceae bacterium]|nr:hypothetical protein [Tannerellaceae bacterium]
GVQGSLHELEQKTKNFLFVILGFLLPAKYGKNGLFTDFFGIICRGLPEGKGDKKSPFCPLPVPFFNRCGCARVRSVPRPVLLGLL